MMLNYREKWYFLPEWLNLTGNLGNDYNDCEAVVELREEPG
jgi:uncharacterized phage-like protein YoqJ